MKRPGPIVEVVWDDSTGNGDWHSPEEALDLRHRITCRCVGYLIHENKRTVTISQGKGGAGQFLGSMAIPRSAIRKMVKL